jgi:alkanesulfonate monooxygenase SsuD/methylene tetrahydromethanopterin reductase-like flavin-dependent oxidoreductase (luciferase family)
MYNQWPILETWATLSSLATVTNRIKLGTMVSCNTHRNPALLSKVAVTLDVISNGRLEFGIGSGSQKKEHLAYGFGFPKLEVRTKMLDEALEVITKLWKKDKATFQGMYYNLKDAVCEPKPFQKPHPPIVVGGCEEKFTLKVTAKYADRFDWGYLPSIQTYQRKLDVLMKYCTMLGRESNEIEKSCWPAGQMLIANSQRELDDCASKIKPKGMTTKDFNRMTLAVTPELCLKLLKSYVDLGVTYFMLYFADLPNSKSLRLFASAIAKNL